MPTDRSLEPIRAWAKVASRRPATHHETEECRLAREQRQQLRPRSAQHRDLMREAAETCPGSRELTAEEAAEVRRQLASGWDPSGVLFHFCPSPRPHLRLWGWTGGDWVAHRLDIAPWGYIGRALTGQAEVSDG